MDLIIFFISLHYITFMRYLVLLKYSVSFSCLFSFAWIFHYLNERKGIKSNSYEMFNCLSVNSMQWLTCAFSCTMTVHSPSFIHGMLAIYFLSKNVLKIDFWAVLLINSLFKGANVVKYKLENEKEMIRHERNETDILDNNKGNFNIHYISFWSKLKYFLGRHYFVCYDCEQYDEFKHVCTFSLVLFFALSFSLFFKTHMVVFFLYLLAFRYRSSISINLLEFAKEMIHFGAEQIEWALSHFTV